MLESIQNNFELKPYTTLQVGGEAKYFADATSEPVLEELIAYAKDEKLAVTILGGGSNVLVSEAGIKGLVIRMATKGISSEVADGRVLFTAQAGEVLDEVVLHAVEKGYWGLENLSHIPGTVGAAPVQNVGAYGVEVESLIQSVRVYNLGTLSFEDLTAAECRFGYRDSLFKTPEGKKYIVVAVTFELTTIASPKLSYKDLQNRFGETQPTLQQVRGAVIEIRSAKFPDWKVVGTAGSFFKNPVLSQERFKKLLLVHEGLPGFPLGDDSVKIPLGWILDKVLHLKGEGDERVGTYQGQALVLVNKGEASADDFVAFAESIASKVKEATDIDIQWEVTKLGF